jgi:hypothetical protein
LDIEPADTCDELRPALVTANRLAAAKLVELMDDTEDNIHMLEQLI